jgi:phosphoribosylanthranilate isomerase
MMNNRQIKICGLRDPENIREVIQLGPDMIGLIFYSGSPRCVTDSASLDFLNRMIDRPLLIGVFVNPDIRAIQAVNRQVRLDGIQLHGNETPDFCKSIRDEGFTVIKAFGIHPGFNFQLTDEYRGHADLFLFDTGGTKPGGSGQRFDWNLLEDYHGDKRFLLSGGIAPDSQDFPGHEQFAGVDLNSRFETSPGIKDIGLIQTFITNFRHE